MVIYVVEVVENFELHDKIHVFNDRRHAGKILAKMLQEYSDRKDVIVLAIPAGGVPVAVQISEELNLSWDLAVARKLHIPWNKEAGFGAVSWDGTVVINKPLVNSLGLSNKEINSSVEKEKVIIQNRLKKFRGNISFPDFNDKIVIVVDDGLASGFSMLVTVKTLRDKVGKLVVAVPTAPVSAIKLISLFVDKIFCANIRSGSFFAVATAYRIWYDLTDEDVLKFLKKD